MGARKRRIRALLTLLTALLLPLTASADEEDRKIEDFYGVYVGSGQVYGAADERDIIVSIEPARKGFSIYTSTVIRNGPDRASPGVKWRAETQNFVKSDMPHVYTPLLRESMFSKRRDPDLVGGDTVAWASVQGATLGVYALEVLEDGHYEMRVYERMLTDLGMVLTFTRYRDGVAVRGLSGVLARADTE